MSFFYKKLRTTIILLSFIAFSIFVLDRPLAIFLHQHGGFLYEPAQIFTDFCDWVFQSFVLVWAVFLLAGSILLFMQKNKMYGWVFFITIVVNITASYTTNQLKSATDRARPSYFFENPNTPDFLNPNIDGDSFPSAHASFYWSIFLPFAFVFRRYAVFLIIVPLLISASRMVQGHHYLSDVSASFAISWLLSEVLWVCLTVWNFKPNLPKNNPLPKT
jgi:membrane-associated phospholipid phosphatase